MIPVSRRALDWDGGGLGDILDQPTSRSDAYRFPDTGDAFRQLAVVGRRGVAPSRPSIIVQPSSSRLAPAAPVRAALQSVTNRAWSRKQARRNPAVVARGKDQIARLYHLRRAPARGQRSSVSCMGRVRRA